MQEDEFITVVTQLNMTAAKLSTILNRLPQDEADPGRAAASLDGLVDALRSNYKILRPEEL